MNTLSQHRGPDSHDIWTDDVVGLGHNRLAIIDTSDDANQPMHFKHLHLVFNGCIYNYKELKALLKGEGYSFLTESDTEVILAAYDLWGVDCFNKFNGQWALTIYDEKSSKLVTSRDRYGIKPLYYLKTERRYACASEMKQLLLLSSWEQDDEYHINYFKSHSYSYEDKTWWKDIKLLKPGYFSIYDINSDSLSITKYYEFPSFTLQNPLEKLKETFDDAVLLRQRSDVPVGLTLSGGLDSSILASFMPSGSRAFTSSFKDWKGDESHFARRAADFNNLDHVLLETDWKEFINQAGSVSYLHDGPINSYAAFSSFKLYEEISRNGIKVCLNGQGSDELFAGYAGFRLRYILHLLKNKPARGIKESLSLLFSGGVKKEYISLFFKSKKKDDWLLKKSSKSEYKSTYQFDFLSQLALKSIEYDGLPSMLSSVDRNSMSNGVESRAPFLDHRVVEIAMNMSDHEKIKNGIRKYPLKKVYKDRIHPKVLNRKTKQGYASPQADFVLSNRKQVIDRVKLLSDFLPKYIHRQNLFLHMKITDDLKLIFRFWMWLEWQEVLHKERKNIMELSAFDN